MRFDIRTAPPPDVSLSLGRADAANAPAAGPRHLRLLTFFRFCAAFWVLVFHLQAYIALPWPLIHFGSNGPYAMSFFFILSGVVLAYGYYDLEMTGTGVRRFYLARFARIYPTYALVHVVALYWFPVPVSEWARWSYTQLASALGIHAWCPPATLGINGATWSISCEFFFYLLFPGLLPLVKILSSATARIRAVTYLCLFIGFLGLADFAYARNGTFPLVYISPLFRLPEFVLGMIIGIAVRERPSGRPVSGWLVLAAVILVLLVSHNTVYRHGAWTRANLIVVPAIAWLLYVAAAAEVSRPPTPDDRRWRVPLYLGRVSYSLFLVQLPVLQWLKVWTAGGSPAAVAFQAAGNLGAAVVVLAILGLAIVAHEAIEKPARRFILRRWPAATLPLAAAAQPPVT